jgi:hypothetical protein
MKQGGVINMKKKELEKLQELHEKICNLIAFEFCEKNDFQFEFWVDIGHIFLASDFYVNFMDAKYDLFSQQPENQYMKYYDDCLKFPNISLNYQSYCNGLRHENLSFEKKRK